MSLFHKNPLYYKACRQKNLRQQTNLYQQMRFCQQTNLNKLKWNKSGFGEDLWYFGWYLRGKTLSNLGFCNYAWTLPWYLLNISWEVVFLELLKYQASTHPVSKLPPSIPKMCKQSAENHQLFLGWSELLKECVLILCRPCAETYWLYDSD